MQYVEISGNLQRLLHSSRIYILKKLMSHKTDFQELIKDLDMVDPNLWSNMRHWRIWDLYLYTRKLTVVVER